MSKIQFIFCKLSFPSFFFLLFWWGFYLVYNFAQWNATLAWTRNWWAFCWLGEKGEKKTLTQVFLLSSHMHTGECALRCPAVKSREIKTWVWVMSASMAGSSCVMFLFGTQGHLAFWKWDGHWRDEGREAAEAAHRQAEKKRGKSVCFRNGGRIVEQQQQNPAV